MCSFPLKAALSDKTTHPLLRAAYLQCVLAFCGEEKDRSLLLLPLMSLERTSQTSSPQIPALEETLIAMQLAIEISFPDPIPAQVWSLADSHSEHLVSNKLIAAASQKSKILDGRTAYSGISDKGPSG